jgi:hypothetical protein
LEQTNKHAAEFRPPIIAALNERRQIPMGKAKTFGFSHELENAEQERRAKSW